MRGITVWQQLLVYAASADDINLLRVISLDRLQKLFDGMHNLRILLLICLVAGQDNIIPVFEGLSAGNVSIVFLPSTTTFPVVSCRNIL